jgi:GntR family transcriptional regulator, transcriptional repressor for pyruvate dehydrogenase complex
MSQHVRSWPNRSDLERSVINGADLSSGITVSARIAAYIREQILEGQLKPGDRLPPERELAEMLHVGRSAVREAMHTLRAQGYISAGRGRNGSFVCSLAGAPIGDPLAALLVPGALQFVDFFELCLVIEPWAASLAAWRRVPADIKAISEALEALNQRPGDLSLDAKLHGCIAQAAHNVFCSHILSELIRLLYENIPEGFFPDPETHDKAQRQHVAIVQAIIERDADGAASNMTEHLTWTAREVCRLERLQYQPNRVLVSLAPGHEADRGLGD